MSRGSTPTEYSIDWSHVWLDRLISAITAQLDWPDILVSFVRRITHSMKALRRQLLLQLSFSILGQQRSRELPSTVKTVGTLTQPFVKSLPLCCGSFSVNVQGGEKDCWGCSWRFCALVAIIARHSSLFSSLKCNLPVLFLKWRRIFKGLDLTFNYTVSFFFCQRQSMENVVFIAKIKQKTNCKLNKTRWVVPMATLPLKLHLRKVKFTQ